MPFQPKIGSSGSGGSGTVTGAANEGAGEGVYDPATSSASTLVFKSLEAGTNVTITDNTDRLTISSTGGASGVTTVGAFSGSAQTNGASISSNTITFGPGSATVPGMVSTAAQTWAGAKTIQTSATEFVTVDPAAQSMIKIQSDRNTTPALFEAKSNGAGTNENAGYIFSTSAGDHVAGISVSGPNTTFGSTYPPSLQRFASSLVNGIRMYTNDSTPATKFDVWTKSSTTSTDGSRLSITDNGVAVFSGNGAVTTTLTVQPNNTSYQQVISNGLAQSGTNVVNTIAGGYAVNYVTNNSSTSGILQQTGSSAGFSIAPNDGTQLVGTGTGGVLVWAQAGPLQLGTSGGGAAVRMQIKANTNINMTLPTYASDAAAGSGGLVTGDLFINSGNSNAVTSKS